MPTPEPRPGIRSDTPAVIRSDTPAGEVAYVALPMSRVQTAAPPPDLPPMNLRQTLLLQGLPSALDDFKASSMDEKARVFGAPPGLAPQAEEDSVVTPRQHLPLNSAAAAFGPGKVLSEVGGSSRGAGARWLDQDKIWGQEEEFFSLYGGRAPGPIFGSDKEGYRMGLPDNRASPHFSQKVAPMKAVGPQGGARGGVEQKKMAGAGSGADGTDPLTTIMVRNIPLSYTNEMLLQEWPNHGQYDLLYLPFNCALNQNLTYAFINFVRPEDALAFMGRWHKARLAKHTSRKPLNVSYASVQGRTKNLLQLKRKRVWRIKFREGFPLVFENGQRASLEDVLEAAEAEEKLLEAQETSMIMAGSVLEL